MVVVLADVVYDYWHLYIIRSKMLTIIIHLDLLDLVER